MDEAPELDATRIVRVFAEHKVDYLLIGGQANRLHGALRLTRDIDMVAERSFENLERVAAALRELGAYLRVHSLTDAEAKALPVDISAEFLRSAENTTWRTTAGDLDVLASMFDRNNNRAYYPDLSPGSSSGLIGSVTVRVAALDDIIGSKVHANRPKDLEALPELRKLLDKQKAAALAAEQINTTAPEQPGTLKPAAERPAPRPVQSPKHTL